MKKLTQERKGRRGYAPMCLIALLCLSGCNDGGDGQGGGSGAADNSAPTAGASKVTITDAREWQPSTGEADFSDPDGDALTYSALLVTNDGSQPSGRLTIDEHTGKFTYIPYDDSPATFYVTASDGNASARVEVDITSVVGDPLLAQEWYLRNTGQLAYSQTDAALESYRDYLVETGQIEREDAGSIHYPENVSVPGIDANVFPVQSAGITGQNALVVVPDYSGMEIAHEDLEANVAPGLSMNFMVSVLDPSDPTNPAIRTGSRGTSVASVIAGTGWNGIGGRGVAPDAKLIGINTYNDTIISRSIAIARQMAANGVSGTRFTTQDNIVAFDHAESLRTAALYAGDSDSAKIAESINEYAPTHMRNGKGALHIAANGDYWRTTGFSRLCQIASINETGFGCVNSNMDPNIVSPYVLSVSAVNAAGVKASSSSGGSNIFLAAPGGEDGFEQPGIIAADQTTCLAGYSSFPGLQAYGMTNAGYGSATEGIFPFDAPQLMSLLNTNCKYTSRFSGTAPASAIVSGVVALIASANPGLNWRQIRDILAHTARPIDRQDEPVSLRTGRGSWLAYPGWVQNAAGLSFSNRYGFGLVDAAAAVDEAQHNPPQLGPMVDTDWISGDIDQPIDIPDNDAAGITRYIDVPDDVTIESMMLRVTISNPDILAAYENGVERDSTAGMNIGIAVTSPSGTRAVLLPGMQSIFARAWNAPRDKGYIAYQTKFLANSFYGESAGGRWKIQIVDASGRSYVSDNGGGYFNVESGPVYLDNNKTNSELGDLALRIVGH
ncbi:S8 family serine peptidase [Salinisphaera sp. Q1T1-3]|uniref:S8 family serine peptidase n=1 Tax=Salinisphaera sp. Q1T1-3 TaxID=2321229 RepID=UPI001313DE8A|nr:S8 family serine peptidase [Salinisphaera sp. Q1T1-3]